MQGRASARSLCRACRRPVWKSLCCLSSRTAQAFLGAQGDECYSPEAKLTGGAVDLLQVVHVVAEVRLDRIKTEAGPH